MAAVAPMDLVVKSGTPASIPLRCTICPKKPNFSDLSHLLTHISSKSHLSHQFKVQLRSRGDRKLQEEIRQYDDWYQRYRIDDLLAERMFAKEQKKTTRKGRPPNASTNKREIETIRDSSVKPEPEEYPEPPSTTTRWPNGTVLFHNSVQRHLDSSGYQTPNLKRSRSDRSLPDTPLNSARSKCRRWSSETETTESVALSELPSENTDFLDDEKDGSKLKGVKYPGMGLFDSADETQRRMRNQRKDDSVLKQMEQASSGIEPTEIVWTEDIEFQRLRDIYATPSIEGSPDRKLEEREAHKQKRGRRSSAIAAPEQQPRQTRSSARTTRQAASRKRNPHHGSADAYDIFRDPPKASPGTARSESPLGEAGFELRRRSALQTLNSNVPLVSQAPKSVKSLSYFPTRDSGTASFTSQPPVPSSHYFQQQHNIGTGTLNPLCVQTRGGYYGPYGYPNYVNESKPPTTNFQAINAMNFSSLSFNAFAAPYASDPAHEGIDEEDFNI
ncbi:hypothetical protein VTK56DRAFT_3418 [Thermocarpiscus australiensis]